MTMPMDLDELLALEEKRDAERLLWAGADAAFRTDVERRSMRENRRLSGRTPRFEIWK